MEWLELINERHTTFAWDDERVPTKDLIIEALKEVHTHIPSKNLQFPYQVRLWRNDDIEKRKKLMTICHRNSTLPIEDDPGNPQVLAPWLLIFNSRYCSDLEARFDTKSSRILDGLGEGINRTESPMGFGQKQTERIEIGIFSAFIMLALANRGIQSGMCQNICNDYDAVERLFPISNDKKALELVFCIGVGYGKDKTIRHEYFDPRVNRLREIPYIPDNTDAVYGRPKFNEIVITDNV